MRAETPPPFSPPRPTASTPGVAPADTFLLAAFREFYRELLRVKHRVEAGEWHAAARPEGAVRSSDGTAVWQELAALLDRQALDASRSGGDIGRELYLQAQYAMAALADEIFLHLDWPGRLAWKENLLEAKLFGTHRAGEVLLERIESVLRGRDPVYAELARVYLMVLALGFEGRLRGSEEGPALLAAYRRALYRFAFRRDPRVVRGEEPVAPAAYAATLEAGEGARLPHLRRWLIAAAVVVAIWIVGGHLVWRHLVSDFEPYVERILAERQRDGLLPLGDDPPNVGSLSPERPGEVRP